MGRNRTTWGSAGPGKESGFCIACSGPPRRALRRFEVMVESWWVENGNTIGERLRKERTEVAWKWLVFGRDRDVKLPELADGERLWERGKETATTVPKVLAWTGQ